MSKWDLQSSQTRPMDACQCLTFGQHSPKRPFQRSTLTHWKMWTQSQLLPSIHPIFSVVHILTQKTYGCISLPSPCSFPKKQVSIAKPCKAGARCHHMWTPQAAQHCHSVVTFCGSCCVTATRQLWDTACVMSRKPEIRALNHYLSFAHICIFIFIFLIRIVTF